MPLRTDTRPTLPRSDAVAADLAVRLVRRIAEPPQTGPILTLQLLYRRMKNAPDRPDTRPDSPAGPVQILVPKR